MRKSLNGNWQLNSDALARYNVSNLKVKVPGSIYSDLLHYKLIEEPYFRANEAKMLDIMKDDYAYSRSFKLSSRDLRKEINLVFLGIDTISEIYVNDYLVTKTYNMHRRYIININDYIRVGENSLKVVIKSCLEFIKEEDKKNTHQLMNMQYAVKGYANIRKAHCMFGWDWGPQMPDGGIWRKCFLEIIDKGRIDDVLVYQDTNKDVSKLNIKVNNHLLVKDTKLVVSVTNTNFRVTKEEKALDHNEFNIDIKNPSLWYPVGYGDQPLYDLEVKLIYKDKVVDTFKQRIGLRDIKIKRIKDEYGESFTVCVNGQDVFIKGSDYIIEDNISPHKDINHTRFLIKAMIEGNQNCIRVWGGALYPSDEFYDLCDEAGILVWQDLMFACGYYNMENELFVTEIKAEIIDNLKRIHNHASLMLICGNNENETAALNWGIPSPEYTKKWYLYQYEELIPSLVNSVAPDIFYWPSSPSSGGGFDDPNSDSRGDVHYWDVWHGNKPIEAYRTIYPRMLSEFGMQSFPCMKTINSFTNPEDRNIYSYVMERHQKNRSANQKIMNYIGSMFKYPKNLEYIAYVSELIQAEAVRYCVEHLRRNYPRCMGAIYWQLNDCWPVASWSSIDYYDRYKALQYYSKRFYAPIIVSVEESSSASLDYTVDAGHQEAKIVITNETKNELVGSYKWMLCDFDGNILQSGAKELKVGSYSKLDLEKLEFDLSFKEQTNCYLRVIVKTNEGVFENYASFVRDKYLELAKPNIKYYLEKKDDEYLIHLVSDTYTKYVWVDLKNTDVIFDDNFFNLYKGEEKVIKFKSNKNIKERDIKIINLIDSF
ncbi:MAG: glycoside hydrolase family 2 protein [Bacilli bacterium]|nr:glycoside hydrolase family 2 protein [Bacilli bacterium]